VTPRPLRRGARGARTASRDVAPHRSVQRSAMITKTFFLTKEIRAIRTKSLRVKKSFRDHGRRPPSTVVRLGGSGGHPPGKSTAGHREDDRRSSTMVTRLGGPGGIPPGKALRTTAKVAEATEHRSPPRGDAGNRTLVLRDLSRSSPSAACFAFLSPGDHAGKTPTGSVTVWFPSLPRDRAG